MLPSEPVGGWTGRGTAELLPVSGVLPLVAGPAVVGPAVVLPVVVSVVVSVVPVEVDAGGRGE